MIGDIKQVKLEFGHNIKLNPVPVGGDYEVGTANYSVQAALLNGDDISDQFSVQEQTPPEGEPANELNVIIVRTRVAGEQETECTGVVTLQADGDADPGEEFPIRGTLDFSYDAPNAHSFEMNAESVPV